MQQIILDAAAGQISTELTKRGVAANTHVLVNVMDGEELPMIAIAGAGKGFDWLAAHQTTFFGVFGFLLP